MLKECTTVEETKGLAVKLAGYLSNRSAVVCFFGDLGAGKTTFIKALVHALTKRPQDEVNSPTFVYLNIYDGLTPVYHFDLYRLRDADEFLSMGFDEFFYKEGVTCVEWSEKIEAIIPQDAIRVSIKQEGLSRRVITITGLEDENALPL